MRMGSAARIAVRMRATAGAMPSICEGFAAGSSSSAARVGLRKVSAAAGVSMPRATSICAMGGGQASWAASDATAAESADLESQTEVASRESDEGKADSSAALRNDKHGEKRRIRSLQLVGLVLVAVVDYDAAEVGDRLDEFLEALVPLGGGLEE